MAWGRKGEAEHTVRLGPEVPKAPTFGISITWVTEKDTWIGGGDVEPKPSKW